MLKLNFCIKWNDNLFLNYKSLFLEQFNFSIIFKYLFRFLNLKKTTKNLYKSLKAKI
jgi:hypothetical protein